MTSVAGSYFTPACAGSTSAQTPSVPPTTLARKTRIGSFGSTGARLRRRLSVSADADHLGAAHQHLGRDAGEIADGENDDDRADAEPAGAHRAAAAR